MRAAAAGLAALALLALGCGDDDDGVPASGGCGPAAGALDAPLPSGFRYAEPAAGSADALRANLPEGLRGGVLVREIRRSGEETIQAVVVPERPPGEVAGGLVEEAEREKRPVERGELEVGAPGRSFPAVSYIGTVLRVALVIPADCHSIVLFGSREREVAAIGAVLLRSE